MAPKEDKRWDDTPEMQFLKSMDEKIDQVHGRMKRVESVVLGDEEKGIIGLTEKFRNLEAERRDADGKRAVFFAVIGWVAATLGGYAFKQVLPEKPMVVISGDGKTTTTTTAVRR